MPVAADQQLDVALFDGVHQLEVIEDGSVLRIVVDQDDGLLLREGFRQGVEPGEAFMRDQRRGHAHVRAAVAAQEFDAPRIEFEVFVAEDLGEGVAAALRPFGVVVARHDPIRMHEFVEQSPREGEFLVRPEIRQVAAEYRELNIRLRIDIGDASLQILNTRRPAQRNMDIAQISKSDRRRLRLGRDNGDYS